MERKCLQIHVYKTKNTYLEVNKANIETFDKDKYHGIWNLKTKNHKSTICTEDRIALWLMHTSTLGRAHY
jgi:hypothetical protein